MKSNLLLLLLMLVTIGSSAQSSHSSHEKKMGNPQTNVVDNKTGQEVYTCSMHPEVLSDKPGNCPKCGMKLVLKKMEGADGDHSGMDMGKTAEKDIPMLPEKIIGGGKVVKYLLYVKDTIVTYGGKPRRAIAVNGQIPMPPLGFSRNRYVPWISGARVLVLRPVLLRKRIAVD